MRSRVEGLGDFVVPNRKNSVVRNNAVHERDITDILGFNHWPNMPHRLSYDVGAQLDLRAVHELSGLDGEAAE